MRLIAVLLGSVCLLQAMTPALAVDDDCISCKQNNEYICLSNFQECAGGCKGFGVPDRAACQRRCQRTHDACAKRTIENCGKCTSEKPALPPPVHIIQ